MNEIETRIIDIDVDDVRSKMLSVGATKVKQENQINNIYDFEDRRLLKEKGYARIRIVKDELNNKDVYFMTTKKLLSQDKYKLMSENEVTINNAQEGANIFTSLGLKLFESIKKL